MAKAGGYILILPNERRNIFENCFEENEPFAEPVPEFLHSRNAPLVCFISAQEGGITHLARGRRGMRAGTQLRRINVYDIVPLDRAVSLGAIGNIVPNRVRALTIKRLEAGGLLTPKSFEAVVDAVRKIEPSSREALNLYSRERSVRIGRLSAKTRTALAFQKEALLTALSLSGLSREPLQEWTPKGDREPLSFLEGLPVARLREDPMVVQDFINLPGYDLLKTMPYNAALFQGDKVRLTVIIANRQELEKQFGTDLIYYNEMYHSFVMVQYKAMESEGGGSAFRIPNEQLDIEIKRMEKVLSELKAYPHDDHPDSYRLEENPFFLKFCSRIVLNPDDVSLVPGMYLPLEYWQLLAGDPSLEGPRGGRRVTFENVDRYLNNTDFVTLTENAWIGTTINQSSALETAIRQTLASGKAVALAVKKHGSTVGHMGGVSDYNPLDPHETEQED